MLGFEEDHSEQRADAAELFNTRLHVFIRNTVISLLWPGLNIMSPLRSRGVFACLGPSHGFLSTIFGILRKFWVDIGKKYFQKTYFFKTKKIATKKIWKNENFEKPKIRKFWKSKFRKNWNFENFQKIRNFGIFKILIFEIFKFLNFQNFKILIFKISFFQIFFVAIFFLGKIFIPKLFFTYINSKIPQDSKNHT